MSGAFESKVRASWHQTDKLSRLFTPKTYILASYVLFKNRVPLDVECIKQYLP